jgi:hypothetical protein
LALLALFAVGCDRSRIDTSDQDLAAVNDFIKSHNDNPDIFTSVISLDSKGMSVMNSMIDPVRPKEATKIEYIFRWDEIQNSTILLTQYGDALIFDTKPAAVTRMFDPNEGFWRRRATPWIDFNFSNERDARNFDSVFVATARKFGAKNLSNSLDVVDHRKPEPSTSEQTAQVD